MVPERLSALRDAAREAGGVLLVYGPGVKDAFVDQAYQRYDLGAALWEALHDAGFSRIVFFSLRGMLTVRDAASRFTREAAGPPGHRRALMGNGFEGPLGGRIMDSEQRDEPPSTPAMSDPHALKMLSHLMDDPARPTAVVFEHAEVIAQFNEAQRGLASALEYWLDYRPGMRNVCVLVFARDGLDEVADYLRDGVRLPGLDKAVRAERGRRKRPGRIGTPHEDELTRLVHRSRIRAGFAIDDWTALPGVVRAMAAQDEPLRTWEDRLERTLTRHGRPLGHQTLTSLEWSSGAVQTGDVWQRIAELRGMEKVKEHLTGLRWQPPTGDQPPTHHMVFTGNPGTGKTTVAGLVGDVFLDLGILRRGHVVAVRAGDLISGHVGGTAIKTDKAVDRALDGVLFIDEAYALGEQSERGYGKEATTALLARMENDRHRLVVVVAGYPDEMRRFLDTDPGLRDRFPEANHLEFPDYAPDTLLTIALSQLKGKSLGWDEEFAAALDKVVTGLYRLRDARFANARTMRNLTDEIGLRWAARVRESRSSPLTVVDLPERHRMFLDPRPPSAQDLLGPLDDMIGLASVKDGVRRLVAKIDHQRRTGTGGVTAPHLLFVGPPGTGKTTVARQIARIFHELGLLAKGQLVEAGREDLVGPYLGHTAKDTSDKFDQAVGGVLFIDEAYALVDSHDGRPDSFGQEAVNTLTRHMENYRGRMSVIAAGYPEAMERFLAANDGLRSRFTERIHFPDYPLPELLDILKADVTRRGLRLGAGTESRAGTLLERAMNATGFGNARSVRKLEGLMYDALSERVFGRDLDDAELRTYLPEDVPDELW